MLEEFLSWWGRQLADLVPQQLRRDTAGSNALVADAAEPGVLTLSTRRRGNEGRLGQFRTDPAGAQALRAALAARPRGEPVLLRLPPAMALERDVILPLAAEREPERVLGYEMERLTPFSADEVFWAYTVRLRDRAHARLSLRLTIVPRVAVQGLIDLLAEAGGRPVLLEAPTAYGLRAITLNHADAAGGRFSWRARALSANTGLAVTGALALLVLFSPILRQSLALADVGDRLHALEPQMNQVEALRRRITGVGAGGDAVSAETRRLGDTLEALAAITEIFPDDSYLTEFTMRERKMTLSGLSASAPKLISGLSADPRIRNPAFTAPVTRQEQGPRLGAPLGNPVPDAVARDVFSIRAELAP